MKWIALVLAALTVAACPAGAEATAFVHRSAPSADVSLPFWCDWGYDWDERCYRDFSDRLAVGGDVDKVWRSALRFPLGAIPRGSVVDSATLSLSFDGVCLAPRRTEQPCPARIYTIDVHPVLSRNWFREREVDFGPVADQGSFWAGAPRRLAWDVTNLVTDWVERGTPNHGLLLKLADGEEDFSVGGPKLPSSEFGDPELRPMLEVTYLPGRIASAGTTSEMSLSIRDTIASRGPDAIRRCRRTHPGSARARRGSGRPGSGSRGRGRPGMGRTKHHV